MPLDYTSQTHTIEVPGGLGAAHQDARRRRGLPVRRSGRRSIKGYQLDGDEIRAFACSAEPRGWFCRARFKSKLADTWSPANVAEQGRFAGHPMPSSGVDAMPQWIDRDGNIQSEGFAGGRVWSYTCGGSPRTCRALDSVDLGAHYARYGLGADTPPTDGVDAATAFVHIDGTGRRYWTKGDRIWRARCDARFERCTGESVTCASSSALAFSPALPVDGVDAMTQFVQNDVLASYVFKGDRVWKYNCTTSGCTPQFTQTIAQQWRAITNQERWADEKEVLTGVTDWGVQATMMNAAFAFAFTVGIDATAAYERLVTRQVADRRVADRSAEGGWSLRPLPDDVRRRRVRLRAVRSSALGEGVRHAPLPQDGWLGVYPTPREQLKQLHLDERLRGAQPRRRLPAREQVLRPNEPSLLQSSQRVSTPTSAKSARSAPTLNAAWPCRQRSSSTNRRRCTRTMSR